MLGTLSAQLRDQGDDVVIVTGDRDTYQLVEDPHVKVLYNRRGVTDYALYDEAGIAERTGVTPAQYPLLAALRGDPSDNLPGVAGVGEKTAAKLVNEYGTIDAIFANLDRMTPKLRQSMTGAEPQVRRNFQLTPIVRDVPVEVLREALRVPSASTAPRARASLRRFSRDAPARAVAESARRDDRKGPGRDRVTCRAAGRSPLVHRHVRDLARRRARRAVRRYRAGVGRPPREERDHRDRVRGRRVGIGRIPRRRADR